MAKDLTFGTDCRGDYALFIDEGHFIGGGWELDGQVADVLEHNPTFFRVISDGEEQSGHGWAELDEDENAVVVQWG